MKRTFVRSALTAAFVGAALTACDDSTGLDGTARVTVLLTDAPADYIDHAMVDIGAVELLGGPGGPVVLSDNGTDGPVDLLELQGAATAALASADIEPGTYTQLRLIVESASVTLAGDLEFPDGSTSSDLFVPSGAQTGIKLNLSAGDAAGNAGGVDIVPGETVLLVVDFDVSESYVVQGNPNTPAGINSVSFRPTLRVVVDDVAGSISGTVSTEAAGATIEGLVVSAEPVEGETLEPFQTTTATATTDENGNYTIFFVVPGDYQVSVDAGEGFTAPTADVTVEQSEDVTGVDFVVVEG